MFQNSGTLDILLERFQSTPLRTKLIFWAFSHHFDATKDCSILQHICQVWRDGPGFIFSIFRKSLLGEKIIPQKQKYCLAHKKCQWLKKS